MDAEKQKRSDESELLRPEKIGTVKIIINKIRQKIGPLGLGLGIAMLGHGYLLRGLVTEKASDIAFDVSVSVSDLSDEEKAYLISQHNIVQKRNAQRLPRILANEDKLEQFREEIGEIADGKRGSVENFNGKHSPKMLIFRNEQLTYGLEDGLMFRGEKIFEKKMKQLEEVKPDEPSPQFLAMVTRTFAPGRAYEFTRSSAVESLALNLSKFSQNCDARAKNIVMALSELYPNRLNDIYLEKFGDHIRVLFQIGGERYVMEGKVEIYPYQKASEMPSVITPLSGYIANEIAEVSLNKIEGLEFHNTEATGGKEFSMAITDAKNPFSLGDLSIYAKLGNYGSLKKAIQISLKRSRSMRYQPPSAQAQVANDKIEKERAVTSESGKSDEKTRAVAEKMEIPLPSREEMEQIIEANQRIENRTQTAIAKVETNYGTAKGTQPQSSGSGEFSDSDFIDVMELEILPPEDMTHKYLSYEEFQKAAVPDEELEKYEDVDPLVIKEIVRQRAIKNMDDLSSYTGVKKSIPGNASYEEAVKAYRNFRSAMEKKHESFYFAYRDINLGVKTLTPEIIRYLRDYEGQVFFTKVLPKAEQLDNFVSNDHIYFIFEQVPNAAEIRKIKNTNVHLAIQSYISAEQARALADSPIDIRIANDIPPLAFRNVIHILRQKKQGEFHYSLSRLGKLYPEFFDDWEGDSFFSDEATEISPEAVQVMAKKGLKRFHTYKIVSLPPETAQAMLDANLEFYPSKDFKITNSESLLLMDKKNSPYSNYHIDGKSDEIMDTLYQLADGKFRRVIFHNLPLTEDILNALADVSEGALNIFESGDINDAAAGILTKAKAFIKFKWTKFGINIFKLLVAQDNLRNVDEKYFQMTFDQFDDANLQEIFSNEEFKKVIREFKGRVWIPRNFSFDGSSAVPLEIIGQQRAISFYVKGSLSEELIRKLNDFQGERLSIRVESGNRSNVAKITNPKVEVYL